MSICCDVCRQPFRVELDRGWFAWALTTPRDAVGRVWIVCSSRCLEALGDLPSLLCPRALGTVQVRFAGATGLA